MIINDPVDFSARVPRSAVLRLHGPGEMPVGAVVLEEVRVRFDVGQIVDRNHLNRRMPLEDRAKYLAADAAEPIDADACHV